MRDKNKRKVQVYYFTFGTSKQYPYKGGWVAVYARDGQEAFKVFRKVYPDKKNGYLNAQSCYTEKYMIETKMLFTGKHGAYQHDVLRYSEVLNEKDT